MSRFISLSAFAVAFSSNLIAANYSYDSLQRLQSADYGNGLVISYTYDTNGNRLSRTVQSNYRLITVNIPSGGGIVTGAGITTVGATATLQATPNSGNDLNSFTDSGIVVSNAPNYSFVVNDSRTLDANFGPIVLVSIAVPPLSQTVVSGTPTSLSATGSGSGQIIYQWFQNGVSIAGATDSTLMLPLANFNSAGSYTVQISNQHSSATSSPALVTVTMGGYGDWKSAAFSTTELSTNDQSVVGVDAIIAPDGRKNLLHYAFGVGPRTMLPAGVSQPVPNTDSTNSYLALSYRHLIGGGGLVYTVEVADDLNGPWDTTGIQIEQVGTSTPTGDGLTEQVLVRLKTPLSQIATRKFMRLRVTLP